MEKDTANQKAGATLKPENFTNSDSDTAQAIMDSGFLDSLDVEEDYEPRVRMPVDEVGEDDEGAENTEGVGETDEEDGSDDEDTGEDEDAEDEEGQDEEPLYTVNIDGKREGVTLEELKGGYQRQADYTRKTQGLAEQRREADMLLNQAAQERAYYQQKLGQLQSQLNEQVGEYENVDWVRLKDEDPIEYVTKREEVRRIKERVQETEAERQRIAYQQAEQMKYQHKQVLERESKLLAEKMPEWADASKQADVARGIRDYALGQGFNENEIKGLSDHRSLLILEKARKYDAIQNSDVKKNRLKTLPKVMKPGMKRSKKAVSASRVKDKQQRLRKTGSVEDAASLFFDLI